MSHNTTEQEPIPRREGAAYVTDERICATRKADGDPSILPHHDRVIRARLAGYDSCILKIILSSAVSCVLVEINVDLPSL